MALCLIASTLRLKRSIGAFEQTPRDDLRLDFCRALENIQDARIAKHAADRILEREAVAAMNLQRVVGVSPGDTRTQQLGHTGFEIATPARILLARRKIRELPSDHRLYGHHHDLVPDAREGIYRLAELHTVERIL